MTTRNPQPFRLAKTRDGGWYWRLVAINGETLCHSETYTTKTKALKGIASAITNVADAVTGVLPRDLTGYDLYDRAVELAKTVTLDEVDE